jgi:hypothetical protein
MVLCEAQQHPPHRVVATVNVVEDQDDRPLRTPRGEQTRDRLDEVVTESLHARSRVMTGVGEREETIKAAPAGTASSRGVWATHKKITSIGPASEWRQVFDEETVRHQPESTHLAGRDQLRS